jgi:tetratricopeptide (TPR) repeat protein
MTQLYNLAFQEYEEGRRLIEQGRVQEALARLNKAVERLTQIKTLFPYNSEAQILTLRIEQLRDRDRFRQVLDDNFRDALGKRELNPTEALNTLEVIKVLSPSYPGLTAAISSLRIRMGLDRPPPDPAKKAEARRLYAEALRIWQQNQRVLFPRAMEQLNTAITLDPDYREAVELKDRMQGALGASRQLILSSDDQRRFREAEGYYLNGQYPEAYQIVLDLLRKPGNQGYRPLLDLRANIEARLGI